MSVCSFQGKIKQFEALENPPQQLFYRGDLTLLDKVKVAIVGTRKPNTYTQVQTQALAKLIAQSGGVVVSGGALGVDILAHQGAYPSTIMVAPTDLNHCYPATNKAWIASIYENALALSEYEANPRPQAYHFLERNRLVVALSDVVVIPQADLRSGSMRSAEIATELNKPLFVFPHRLKESEGTDQLVYEGKAQMIFDFAVWASGFLPCVPSEQEDEVLVFCSKMPTFQEALDRFGSKMYEYELEGKIGRKNGAFYVL
ncbi:DNA protecting protein DprA [Helicobacter enhydrae]|uniref:DNA protecting protein DprA n=1 Tax=Helicobacter enhydrae TaxID=222136 RepID=A0A1B1U5Y5_9HELI|nr:DNA-processing protein DprA [Helicobacter enhydrae]ANV98193.1 DNA protecting protein DprA [Helicobacter enhydrae]